VRTLVLWDIDLTLLDLRRLGGRWYRQAVRSVTGHEVVDLPPFGGRTDRWIACRLLSSVGVEPTEEAVDRLHNTVARIADADRRRVAEVGIVLPGVPEVLGELAALPHVEQTLVTGNLREIAAVKLSAFGLDKYLDLDSGGYGALSEQRSALVAAAVDGATRRHGVAFPGSALVVVGDTPHDVHGALAHDARAVGVATGTYPADALLAAGAHAVLPDLADTTAAVTAILG
jgi:phosphoglycolate phosphatase-like HAD superfamily hydrolase